MLELVTLDARGRAAQICQPGVSSYHCHSHDFAVRRSRKNHVWCFTVVLANRPPACGNLNYWQFVYPLRQVTYNWHLPVSARWTCGLKSAPYSNTMIKVKSDALCFLHLRSERKLFCIFLAKAVQPWSVRYCTVRSSIMASINSERIESNRSSMPLVALSTKPLEIRLMTELFSINSSLWWWTFYVDICRSSSKKHIKLLWVQ